MGRLARPRGACAQAVRRKPKKTMPSASLKNRPSALPALRRPERIPRRAEREVLDETLRGFPTRLLRQDLARQFAEPLPYFGAGIHRPRLLQRLVYSAIVVRNLHRHREADQLLDIRARHQGVLLGTVDQQGDA